MAITNINLTPTITASLADRLPKLTRSGLFVVVEFHRLTVKDAQGNPIRKPPELSAVYGPMSWNDANATIKLLGGTSAANSYKIEETYTVTVKK